MKTKIKILQVDVRSNGPQTVTETWEADGNVVVVSSPVWQEVYPCLSPHNCNFSHKLGITMGAAALALEVEVC